MDPVLLALPLCWWGCREPGWDAGAPQKVPMAGRGCHTACAEQPHHTGWGVLQCGHRGHPLPVVPWHPYGPQAESGSCKGERQGVCSERAVTLGELWVMPGCFQIPPEGH